MQIRIEKVADAILRELRRQDDADPCAFLFHISDDLSRVGIDGHINLREVARVAISAMENET